MFTTFRAGAGECNAGVVARQEFGASVRPIVLLLPKCGGRKRIVASDGSAIVPSSKLQPDGTLEGARPRVAVAADA
jgi:hypothetical protein